MSDEKAKRNMNNSVFTSLFEEPENQVRLYRDLHPEEPEVCAKDIQDVTLKAVLTNRQYNDLGFTVHGRTIILLEAQSTWNPNMALRSLMYLAESYKDYLHKTRQSVYGKKAVQVPKPELYVLYTGEEKHDESELSLARIHWEGDDSFVNVRVMIQREVPAGSILYEYSEFTKIYQKQKKLFDRKIRTISSTIEICIRRGILKSFFEK